MADSSSCLCVFVCDLQPNTPRAFHEKYLRLSAVSSASLGQAVGSFRLRLELNLPVVGGFVLFFAALQLSGTILRLLNTSLRAILALVSES